MSSLTITHKTFLEAVLSMRSGYVLDFTDGSFERFFADLGIDINDPERYSGFGRSKANRLRALWQVGSNADVGAVLGQLADYIDAKQYVGELADITGDQIVRIREIAHELLGESSVTAAGAPVPITSSATVAQNRISIEIHDDIYRHVKRYFETGDYFHAVDESYKLVRGKLRELTGHEKATDVFNQAATSATYFEALFGKSQPGDQAEGDFFRGVGYLHLGVQFLRNEKAHTLAAPLEPNLALHYVSLASLAYDLITRYVSSKTIEEIEQLVQAKRASYQTARAFYRDFENGHWLRGMTLPAALHSASVRTALKEKWLDETDFTQSFDHSNLMLMRLQLVADALSPDDVDRLLALPGEDRYGNDQRAGMEQFLEFLEQRDPGSISDKAKAWLQTRTP